MQKINAINISDHIPIPWLIVILDNKNKYFSLLKILYIEENYINGHNLFIKLLVSKKIGNKDLKYVYNLKKET